MDGILFKLSENRFWYVQANGDLGVEIYTQGDKTDHHKLWQTVLVAGKEHGMVVGVGGSMEPRRIEAGIFNNGTDMDMSMTPLDAGPGAMVNFDNQNFIGREALLKAYQRPVLLGVLCKMVTPAKSSQIRQGGEVVGCIRTGHGRQRLNAVLGTCNLTMPIQGLENR